MKGATLVGDWWTVLITAIAAVIASSGFWTFVIRRNEKNSMTSALMMGIAYEKIIAMGMGYVERGWITDDEYGDYRKQLYDPYKALGGNGVTERIMAEVANLPIRSRNAFYVEVIQATKARSASALPPELVDSSN
jgi:Tfp pilus assembly protein PilE